MCIRDRRGIVQLSHGMCEYFSRYTAFAKYLCGLGFIVCGNDHIGHGASVSRDADLGFFSVRDGWKYLVEDVKQLTDLMQHLSLIHISAPSVRACAASAPICAPISSKRRSRSTVMLSEIKFPRPLAA